MDKVEARGVYRAVRDRLSPEIRLQADRKIYESLFALSRFTQAEDYFVYLSFSGEVPTAEIISELVGCGKHVYVPKIIGGKMFAVALKPPFAANKWGISEPVADEKAPKIDVCVTPLLAADKHLARVGYGKGFYDRFFKEIDCFKVGICYSAQVADFIETDDCDVKLDALVTEKFILGENS